MCHFCDFNVPRTLTSQTKCRTARIALPGSKSWGLFLVFSPSRRRLSWLHDYCFFLTLRHRSITNTRDLCCLASANAFSSRDWDVEQLGATTRVASTRSSRPTIAPSNSYSLRPPITRTVPGTETLINLASLRKLRAHVHPGQLSHLRIVVDSVRRIHHMHRMIILVACPTIQITSAFIFFDVSMRIDDIDANFSATFIA